MTLTIPAGVDNGKRIAIPHQGDAGANGGPSGDLIVILHVEEHPYFERDGQDLYCAIPVSFTLSIMVHSFSVSKSMYVASQLFITIGLGLFENRGFTK